NPSQLKVIKFLLALAISNDIHILRANLGAVIPIPNREKKLGRHCIRDDSNNHISCLPLTFLFLGKPICSTDLVGMLIVWEGVALLYKPLQERRYSRAWRLKSEKLWRFAHLANAGVIKAWLWRAHPILMLLSNRCWGTKHIMFTCAFHHEPVK